MSEADQTIEEARNQFSQQNRKFLGMVRRMAVTVTSGAFWQVVGGLLLDGVTKETRAAEPFSGIGFYARPAPGVNAEAIVLNVGAAPENPVIVATRDEDSRKKFANIAQDETSAYNTRTKILILKTGEVTVGRHTAGDTALRRLAFVDELNDLRAWVINQFTGPGHTHATPSGVTTAVTPFDPTGAPDEEFPGTDILRSQ
jgi:hypothetical protein